MANCLCNRARTWGRWGNGVKAAYVIRNRVIGIRTTLISARGAVLKRPYRRGGGKK